MKIRKNKHYTSVLLEAISLDEFKQANEAYKSLKDIGRNTVVKPTKKALEAFIGPSPLTLGDVIIGDTYKVLGVYYTALKYNQCLVQFEYTSPLTDEPVTFTPFTGKGTPLVASLWQESYTALTGDLIGF